MTSTAKSVADIVRELLNNPDMPQEQITAKIKTAVKVAETMAEAINGKKGALNEVAFACGLIIESICLETATDDGMPELCKNIPIDERLKIARKNLEPWAKLGQAFAKHMHNSVQLREEAEQ